MEEIDKFQSTDIENLRKEISNKLDWRVFVLAISILTGILGTLFGLFLSSRSEETASKIEVTKELAEIKTDVKWIKGVLKGSEIQFEN